MKYRPITGQDVLKLSARLGAKKTEISAIYGWNNSQYYDTVNASPDTPLKPKVALLTRLLTDRPELMPFPALPTPREVFEEIKQVMPEMTEKKFSAMLGLSASHVGALMDEGSSVRPITGNFLLAIKRAMDAQKTANGKRQEIQYFIELAEKEAMSRGIDKEKLWSTCWRGTR